MSKKVKFDLIFGYFLLILGVGYSGYFILVFIINLVSLNIGVILIAKDISVDIVLILLGLLFIRKKKENNFNVL